jgi:hypothetical protein
LKELDGLYPSEEYFNRTDMVCQVHIPGMSLRGVLRCVSIEADEAIST